MNSPTPSPTPTPVSATASTRADLFNRSRYFDAQASTPLCAESAASMRPFLEDFFGNPHSSEHAIGWRVADEIERARGLLSRLLGVRANELLFTSGATESNNTAIKGVLSLRREREGRNGIITLASEHKCVLRACRYAARFLGAELQILPIERDGLLDLSRLESALSSSTALVSVMAANNEIGVLQPLESIAELAHSRGAWFHTDAAQALGKVGLPMGCIDLASFSSHKSYGPIGVGALYVAHRRRISFEPLLHGGGQEGGVRSGTLSPMLVAGFGAAAGMLFERGQEDTLRIRHQTELFLSILRARDISFRLNGVMRPRLAGNLNISFAGITAEQLMSRLSDFYFSATSACSGGAGLRGDSGDDYDEGSHVLRAIGLDEGDRSGSVRIGLHRYLSDGDVRFAAEAFAGAISDLGKK